MKPNLNSPLVEVRPLSDLREMLLGSVALWPDKTAFLTKPHKGGDYVPVSYRRFAEEVEVLGSALMARGLGIGTRVAIVAETRYEWYVSYLATVVGEAVVVPLDKELPAAELENMLRVSEASCVFYSQAYEKTMLEAASQIAALKLLVPFDPISEHLTEDEKNAVLPYAELKAEGQMLLAKGDRRLREHPIDPEEMRILLFTSGTTSVAKPVMHCHRSICANLMAMCQMVEIHAEDVFLSVLPLHHTYECTCGFLCPIYRGATIAQCEGLRYIIKNLKESRTSVVLTVPLMLEAFNRGIWKNINAKPKQARLVRGLIGLSRGLRKVKLDLRAKAFAKIHDNFGGHLRLMIAGGAAIDPQILQDFDDFGFVAIQGYGLTECGPILALNRVEARKHESAGLPLPGVDVKIIDADESGVGEIVGRGPNIMLGYWNEPEATARALEGGYFHTGDLGYIDADGFIIISGRKKNVIVTKNGKNIYPEELEFALCRSERVAEALVSGRPANGGDLEICAEIFPDAEALKAANGGLEPTPQQAHALIEAVVKEVNASVVPYKKIKAFKLRDKEFEKTTSKKIKRAY